MSNEEKVALAETTKDDYGLPTVFPQGHRDDVAALELPRSTWYYHQKHVKTYTEKYAHLREPLEDIARDNPAYGYRRTTEELKELQRHRINHKVVPRLHQERKINSLPNQDPGYKLDFRIRYRSSSVRRRFFAIRSAMRPSKNTRKPTTTRIAARMRD